MVEDGDIGTWDFTYDSKGRLTSINHAEKYNGRTDRYITNYTWGNNVIKAEDGNSTRTYTLNNNLVKSISDTDDNDWSNATLTYNSSNQLIAVQNTYEGKISIDAYTWNNDRIVKQIYTEMIVTTVKKIYMNTLTAARLVKATSLFTVRLIMMIFSMCIPN